MDYLPAVKALQVEVWAREVAQWLEVVPAPLEDPGLILRTCVEAHTVCNFSSRG